MSANLIEQSIRISTVTGTPIVVTYVVSPGYPPGGQNTDRDRNPVSLDIDH
jgi:hypothetical protein